MQSTWDGITAWLEFRLKATTILPPAAAVTATATATAYWTFIHPLQCQEPQASVRQSVQPWASQEQVSQCESINLRTDVRCLKKNKCLSILNSIGFHSTSCLKGEKLSLFESIYFTNFCFFKQWLPLGCFRKVLNSTPKLHYHFLVHRLVITRNRYTELCYLEGRRPLLPAAKLQIHTPEWCDDHVVSNKYRCSIVISISRK